MNLDSAFVSSLLREGKEAMRKAVDRGIRAEYLTGDSQKAFEFIAEFQSKYGAYPGPDELQGKLGYALIDITSPSDFYIDEVLNRRLHTLLQGNLKEVIAHLENRSPKEAYAVLEAGIRAIRTEQLVEQKSINLLSLAPEFLAYYDKLKAGEKGILTPWPTINESTMGFWPEDFVLIVARLGIGKTWTLTLMAHHMWDVQKKRVLFASTEMNKLKILQRFYASRFKFSYDEFRRAKLSAFAEDRLRNEAMELAGMEGMYIVGGEFDFRIESLEAAIEDCQPDIVLLDGAYLLRVDGDGRQERAANSFDEIKRLAKRRRIPIVATTQFNRQAKVNSAQSASVEKIALSDTAGWNADLIFGMVQTEDMKRDGRMIFKPMKFREGIGEEVECWWNFETMDFSEVKTGSAEAPMKRTSGAPVKAADLYSTGLDFGTSVPSDDGGDSGVPF